MSRPFTNEVVRSLDFLRQAVTEVEEGDPELAETMTAIVDDLVVNMENQMMLVFANCNIQEKEREAMLTKTAADVSILDYYQQSRLNENENDSRKREEKQEQKVIDLSLGKGVPAEVEALRSVSTSLYMLMESLAHNVKAESAQLFLAHRGTGSLRVVTSVPDFTAAQKGLFIPLHQGLPGATFSCEVAIHVDEVDEEMRRNYVAATDEALKRQTFNSLCMPIIDRVKGTAIGVIECSNKVRGSPWSASDEALMHHAAVIASYFITSYDVDFSAGYTFNPAALHTLRPYKPAPFHEGLESLPAAMDFARKQLVARVRDPSLIPVAVKGKSQPSVENADEVNRVLDVKEMRTYLKMIDESHLRAMSELVTSQDREEKLKKELEKTQHRMRVLDENSAYLQEQLQDAKRAISLQTFGNTTDPNYADFDGTQTSDMTKSINMAASTSTKPQDSLLAASTKAKEPKEQPQPVLPPITKPGKGAKLHDFMMAATSALDQLRSTALTNSDAVQRARMFSTPQPTKSSFVANGASSKRRTRRPL